MGFDNFTTPIFNGSKYIDEGVWGLFQYPSDISGGAFGVQWVLLNIILMFGFFTKLYGLKRGSLVSFFISSFLTSIMGIFGIVTEEIVIISIIIHIIITLLLFIIEYRSQRT